MLRKRNIPQCGERSLETPTSIPPSSHHHLGQSLPKPLFCNAPPSNGCFLDRRTFDRIDRVSKCSSLLILSASRFSWSLCPLYTPRLQFGRHHDRFVRFDRPYEHLLFLVVSLLLFPLATATPAMIRMVIVDTAGGQWRVTW